MTDHIKKQVIDFTLKLQTQTSLPLWSLANEQVIYAIAIGAKPSWGPRMKRLHRWMEFCYQIRASNILIFLVGLLKAISIFWRVRSTRKKEMSYKISRVFAGFGASSEEYLYADYIKKAQVPTLRINWVTGEGLSELACPRLFSIILILLKQSFGYTGKIKNSIHAISSHPIDFLTVCAANIGSYAFYADYFRLAKKAGIDEATFLALDMPAFGCVDSGIKTIYLQHGLMAISVLIPKINRIDVLTHDEAYYLKSNINAILIRIINQNRTNHFSHQNVMLCLSLNVFQEERLVTCKSLVEWAVMMGLKIVIRPTQKVNQDELHILQKEMPYAIIDDISLPFEDSLAKWQPKLVTAWSSTGLATALQYGSIPISIYNHDMNEVWDKMVYPMKKRAMFWPRDNKLIEAVLKSEEAYHNQLVRLREGQRESLKDDTDL